MNGGSIFSGGGGIELGFEWAGFTTKWFVELEAYPRAILQKRFPNAKIYVDAKKVDFAAVPKVDFLSFGFPCQDISEAGRRVGIKGSRSSLWKVGFKAIRILRPSIAFIENVSALTHRGLNVVLADLAEIGYDAEWHCVSASSIGAIHKRNRLFIIAYPNGQRFKHRENMGEIMESEGTAKWKNEEVEQREGWRILRTIKNNKMAMQRARESLGFEPLISGTDDGISEKLDRIKCLGNAVVPQVAEVFAKAIKEVEEEKTY